MAQSLAYLLLFQRNGVQSLAPVSDGSLPVTPVQENPIPSSSLHKHFHSHVCTPHRHTQACIIEYKYKQIVKHIQMF